ncbi:hypothetical protein LAZ67_12000006 [Cordylochernes scorpioides]|uniref:Uncharacterized protein n=1 Tax=Cordylochernes scorpioides TaxID=51811 RepID=A0ABY6L0N5_9ARAC|nr:hypothetical protein LAZ67_12000006 [Cordylochernes scorpioides]
MWQIDQLARILQMPLVEDAPLVADLLPKSAFNALLEVFAELALEFPCPPPSELLLGSLHCTSCVLLERRTGLTKSEREGSVSNLAINSRRRLWVDLSPPLSQTIMAGVRGQTMAALCMENASFLLNVSALVIKIGSTTQWQADLAPKEMAASDIRNRRHVQLLLTWSTNAAHPKELNKKTNHSPDRIGLRTMKSKLKSGHLQTMTFQNGCRVFPLCTKCNSQPATPRHIIDCIDSSIDELYSSPADTVNKLYKLDALV